MPAISLYIGYIAPLNLHTLFFYFYSVKRRTNNRSYMKRLLYLLATLLAPIHVSAQMLFSENMTMSIDSTKTLQGTISPSLNFQTEKEEVFTFRNSANINLLIKRSRVINLINKFEFSSYGKKVTLSGGDIHA